MENISREIYLNQLSRNASDEALEFHLTEPVALIIQIIITTTLLPQWSAFGTYYQFIASSYACNLREACSNQVYNPPPFPNHREVH